jgi:uncharacterized membrane protein
MGAIGNRYLQGLPNLPFAQIKVYANTDVFLDLVFVDHTGTQVTPTTISIEIDDITNSITMNGPTVLSPTGSTTGNYIYPAFASSMYLQIAAALMQMDFPSIGSQYCQVGMTFTATDSVTGQPFTSTAPICIIELVGIPTVSGNFP